MQSQSLRVLWFRYQGYGFFILHEKECWKQTMMKIAKN